MRIQRERPPLRAVDGIVLLDKPIGLSSNDALQRVKRLFRAQKAGHTGSLDPLASGLLPVCLGEATKLCGLLLDGDKHYEAVVRIGESTTTGDAEGEVIERSDAAMLDEKTLRDAIARFIGEIEQIPPMYSALKHEGRALYSLAREGISVERRARQVQIHVLELREFQPGRVVLEVRCSKGTYIRTLAEDIFASVGQRAHLAGLRRLGAEPFQAPATMVNLDELTELARQGDVALDRQLIEPAVAVNRWPQLVLQDEQLARLENGQRLRLDSPLPEVAVAALDLQGRLRCLGRCDSGGVFHPERLLRRH
jgi:tRNA pseudouridine55 synthase